MGQKALFCEVIRSLRACPELPPPNPPIAAVTMFQLRTPLFSGLVITSVTTSRPFPAFPSISSLIFAYGCLAPSSGSWRVRGPGCPSFVLVPSAARGLRSAHCPTRLPGFSMILCHEKCTIPLGFSGTGGRREKEKRLGLPAPLNAYGVGTSPGAYTSILRILTPRRVFASSDIRVIVTSLGAPWRASRG